jgi:hypothetical protein
MASRDSRAGRSAEVHGLDIEIGALVTLLAAVVLAWVAFKGLTGPPQIAALVAAFLLVPIGLGRRDVAKRWQRGASGEAKVGRQLELLRDQGWLVVHDLLKPTGGNVDHVVAGPGGVFTVETKLRRFGRSELRQARSHAAWAGERLGRWVVPILCLANGKRKPKMYAGVWCMDASEIHSFLRAQPGPGADIASVQAALGM